MKRLFSVPGLRWRGRIKQFERDVYDNWADCFDRSIWTSWCNHWVEDFAQEIPEGSAILTAICISSVSVVFADSSTDAVFRPSHRDALHFRQGSPSPRDRKWMAVCPRLMDLSESSPHRLSAVLMRTDSQVANIRTRRG